MRSSRGVWWQGWGQVGLGAMVGLDVCVGRWWSQAQARRLAMAKASCEHGDYQQGRTGEVGRCLSSCVCVHVYGCSSQPCRSEVTLLHSGWLPVADLPPAR